MSMEYINANRPYVMQIAASVAGGIANGAIVAWNEKPRAEFVANLAAEIAVATIAKVDKEMAEKMKGV